MKGVTRTERRTVWFSGRVQGVGFRQTTYSIAERHAVMGYVKNLEDGRVLLLMEGEPAVLDSMQTEIAGALGRFIVATSVESTTGRGEFNRFVIEY